MMHSGHVAVAAGVGFATAPIFSPDLMAGALWVGIVTVSSLLPDIDHPSSMITRILGPLTKTISFFVRLFVKHRGLTHQDLGIALWTCLLAYGCTQVGLPVWLALASGMGCAAHALGDMWTVGGLRPFVLFPKVRIQISDEKAGAGSEPFVAGAALIGGAVLCGAQLFF
jgi:membrane-bound metal-dependent hydrolase YbcI (DUF457 family)